MVNPVSAEVYYCMGYVEVIRSLTALLSHFYWFLPSLTCGKRLVVWSPVSVDPNSYDLWLSPDFR